MNWPFPPPGGPIPWTPQQIRDYKKQQQQQEQQDRDQLPDAPF